MLITGKGYADYQTKYFLKILSHQLPNLKFFYMGDFDPHGLEIYLNYCFGTAKSCFENFNLPKMEFIGIDGVKIFENGQEAVQNFQCLDLTVGDLDKIEWMLDAGYMDEMMSWGIRK